MTTRMRALFDQGTPVPLRRSLSCDVETAAWRGWSALSNGDLLAATENAGFDVLVTTDRNLRYQQNLTGRRIGIVVLLAASWPRIRTRIPEIAAAIERAEAGSYEEVPIR